MSSIELKNLKTDYIFNGGDLDCGSGLVLLIRQNMLKVPINGILEMQSKEASVETELPPWCKMVGHKYLGKIVGENNTSYFIKKGEKATQNNTNLEDDKKTAAEFEWKIRARVKDKLESVVYFRNFSFNVGQLASFKEKDKNPSAIEYLMGALAGSIITPFKTECVKNDLIVDDVEMTMKCKLSNLLSVVGIENKKPEIQKISFKCFVTSFDDTKKIKQTWKKILELSPIFNSLKKSIEIETKILIL